MRCARSAQRARRRAHHARGDEQRQRDDALGGLPALHRLRGDIPGHATSTPCRPARCAAPRGPSAAARPAARQPAGEPGIALRPGEHALALGLFARRVEAVAAGEVVQAGPGRDGGDAGAVVVAAAVVEVPAQVRVVEAFAVEPGAKVTASSARWLAATAPRSGSVNRARFWACATRSRKAPVLRQRGGSDALHGQQAVLPVAVEEQPLLRAVDQVALVVRPAAGDASGEAELLQQIVHLAGAVAGHRQVVRAERAGDAADACRRGCCRRRRPRVRARRNRRRRPAAAPAPQPGPRCRRRRSARRSAARWAAWPMSAARAAGGRARGWRR